MKTGLLFAILLAVVLIAGCTLLPPQPPEGNDTQNLGNNTTTGGGDNGTGIIVVPPPTNDTSPPQQGTNATNQTVDLGDDRILGQRMVFAESPASPLEIYVFNVGVAQAILLKKGDFHMLIDTAKKDTVNSVISNMQYMGVERLDVLALTNNMPDSAGGLAEVLNGFKISEVWTNNVTPTGETLDTYNQYMVGKIPIKRPIKGDAVQLNGIRFQILNPPNDSNFVGEDVNSIVMKISDRGTCMLVMSNAPSSIESYLISRNVDLSCQILVLGNHGGGLSTDFVFLDKVKPKSALISAGIEEANYPNSAVLERLRLRSIPYYVTSGNGTLKVVVDSTGYTIVPTLNG